MSLELEKRHVVHPMGNFRGRSYGDWAATWANWLLSEDPDSNDDGDGHILFLRGNIGYYAYAADSDNSENSTNKNEEHRFYNRTGDQSVVITEGTAVFIPILTALYFIGGPYEGGTLQNEEQVRYAARKENDKSAGMWAVLQRADKNKSSKSGSWEPIVQDIELYRAESPLFKLTISDRNPFLKYYAYEYPMDPGEYQAVIDGYFLIIGELPSKTCRIRFGGKGRGNYRTDAIYDIHVVERPKGLMKDISTGNSYPGFWSQDASPSLPDYSLPSLQELPSKSGKR